LSIYITGGQINFVCHVLEHNYIKSEIGIVPLNVVDRPRTLVHLDVFISETSQTLVYYV